MADEIQSGEILLKELQRSYKSEDDLKKTLEDKAKNVITISGIIITILTGITSLLLSIGVQLETYFLIFLYGFFFFASLSIFFALLVMSVRQYHYVLSADTRNLDWFDDGIEQYKSLKSRELQNLLIEQYQTSIKINAMNNEDKGSRLMKSQVFLSISLILLFAAVISTSYYILIQLFE